MKFNIIFSVIVLAFYSANRFFGAFAGLLPDVFTQCYFGDLCGGALFVAYTNILLIVTRYPRRIDSVKGILLIEALCAVSWEIIGPLIMEKSVGDVFDAVMYFIGGFIYYFAFKIAIKSKA